MRECLLDASEGQHIIRYLYILSNCCHSQGADIMMVKPAILYLDVIMALRQNSNIPIAAYLVSGGIDSYD